VSFDEVDSLDVCRVDVVASKRPMYVNWKGDQQFFFVRLNNGTRPFNMSETVEYVAQHFR
jgi:hypothetical protein